jgi:hypothetical protein
LAGYREAIVRLVVLPGTGAVEWDAQLDLKTLVDPTKPFPLNAEPYKKDNAMVLHDAEEERRWRSICTDLGVSDALTEDECTAQMVARYNRVYTAHALADYHQIARRRQSKKTKKEV